MDSDAIMASWAKLLNCTVDELGEGEFFFDRFTTVEALDQAWSLIPDHKAIRERVDKLQEASATAEELGGVPMYHIPRQLDGAGSLTALIEDYLSALIPIANEAGAKDLLKTLRQKPKIVAVDAAKAPENSEFEQEVHKLHSVLDHLPNLAPYWILYNYAVYLAKDNRVTAYVLWPCLRKNKHLERAYTLGFELWRNGAYLWTDKQRKTIYVAQRK